MTRKKYLIILFICLLSLSTAFADPIQPDFSTQLSSVTLQLTQLQNEMEIVKSYSSQFLQTIYWSLGVVASIALILVGFGWFTNFRLLDQEKKSIRSEMQTTLKSDLKDSLNRIDERYSESQKLVTDLIEQAIKRSETRMLFDIGSKHELLESRTVDLERSIQAIHYELEDIEYRRWTSEGVYTNAIRCAVGLVNIAISIKQDFRISRALDYILRSIKRLNEEHRTRMTADDISYLQKTLETVYAANSFVIDAIREQIAQMKV